MSQRNMRQVLTYWAPPEDNSTDLYGKSTFTAPIQLECRWEDRTEELRSKKGEEFVSKSRVFVVEQLHIDGYVFLGVSTQANPVDEPDAKEIQALARQPDLRNIRQLTVLYL